MAVHGDITEITYNHPTIGQGVFFAKANEGNTLDTGGIRTADDTSMIAGDSSIIAQKNRVRASFEVLLEDDQNVRNDSDIAKQLAASPVPAEYTISIINGTVWAGSGFPVGDIQTDVNAGTFTLKVAAPIFKKIVG